MPAPTGGTAHRRRIAAWLASRSGRIGIQPTREGREYRRAIATWDLAGRPAALEPANAGRGERSVLEILDAVEGSLADGESVVVITDDRKARAALRLIADLDIDLMGTESFIAWMAGTFRVAGADTAWQTIRAATDERAPRRSGEDPVYIRNRPRSPRDDFQEEP